MKLPRSPGERCRHDAWRGARSVAAFTMIEIALALAVIGFALLAIIGILPRGMTVQKENREETIINQDATLWLQAIRSGRQVQGAFDLARYVDAITNFVGKYNASTGSWQGSEVNGYTAATPYALDGPLKVIGLLSTPKFVADRSVLRSNHVVAYVRALNGPVVDKLPQNNAGVLQNAFSYRLTAEVVPVVAPGTNTVARSGFDEAVVRNLTNNLHEIRLTFRWPLLPTGNTGPGRQTFRTAIGGQIVPFKNSPLFFLETGTYSRAL